MSLLPGPPSWRERLATRSRFLESCAAEANDLSNRFGAPLPVEAAEALPRDAGRKALARLVRIDLLIGAAELAFCLDETTRALKLIRSALIELKGTPRTLMFLARQAYFGVLSGKEIVSVGDSRLRTSAFEAGWSSICTVDEFVRNLTALVFAGLASGSPQENVRIAMTAYESDPVTTQARSAFMASPEAAIIGLFGVARPRGFLFFDTPEDAQTYAQASMGQAFEDALRFGNAALTMMEYSYQRRIDLLQSNALSWKSVAPKTSMLDWPLLMVHVALLRRRRASFLEKVPPVGDAVFFIRSLAKELFAKG